MKPAVLGVVALVVSVAGAAWSASPAELDRLTGVMGLEELIDIVDGSSHKVIVFTPFVESVNLLATALETEGYDVRKIWGAVPKPERDTILADFQHSGRIKVLVAHPVCMSHGLTLTAADTIVWFGPHPSLEVYEQACARITRPGQTQHTHIIHIESTEVERRIYSALRQRADAQTVLLEMFRADSK